MSDDCVCLYGDDDGDRAEFYKVATVCARGEHRCYECQCGIWPGDSHHCVTGKWDGEVMTMRFCVACWDISQSLYCDGVVVFGQLWDNIEDQLFIEGAMNSACLDKLATVEGKRYLSGRWWDWVQTKDAPYRRQLKPCAYSASGGGLL